MKKLLKKQSQLIEQYQMSNEKEQLLIQAIKNLIIKNNYLQLLLELSDNNITEEEFNKELDQHSEKYFIDVKNELNEKTLLIILDIFKQLGNDFYINDITDLFSINTDNINISSTNKKQINQIINNKKEGYWEEYYDNSELKYKGNYKNGEKEGYWERYWSNGNIQYKGNYKNGKKDGYWEWYNVDGSIAVKGNYKNGKEEGYWKYYHDNGKLFNTQYYKQGKLDGCWECYYENEILKFKEIIRMEN